MGEFVSSPPLNFCKTELLSTRVTDVDNPCCRVDRLSRAFVTHGDESQRKNLVVLVLGAKEPNQLLVVWDNQDALVFTVELSKRLDHVLTKSFADRPTPRVVVSLLELDGHTSVLIGLEAELNFADLRTIDVHQIEV